MRRLRRFYLGLRHRRANFGYGCDIRSGLQLDIWRDGSIIIGPGCVLAQRTLPYSALRADLLIS
jgi:hypothetical protein